MAASDTTSFIKKWVETGLSHREKRSHLQFPAGPRTPSAAHQNNHQNRWEARWIHAQDTTDRFHSRAVAGGVQFASVQWLSEASNPPGAGRARERNIFLQFRGSPRKFVTSNCGCSLLWLPFPRPPLPQHQSLLLCKSGFPGQRKWSFSGTRKNFPKAKISFSDKHVLFKDSWVQKEIFFFPLWRKVWLGISLIPFVRNPHRSLGPLVCLCSCLDFLLNCWVMNGKSKEKSK